LILQIEIGGRLRHLAVERTGHGHHFRFTIDGRPIEIDAARVEPGAWSLVFPDGSHHLVAVTGTPASGFTVHLQSGDLRAALPEIRRRQRSGSGGAGVAGRAGPVRILAPMPGKVVRLLLTADQKVRAGQGVVVVEAMKMENELRAPRDGIVKAVLVREGDAVEAGALLAVIE